MRHHNSNRKFGRQAGERGALMRSLMVSLIVHEKITTTEAKAKELRPAIEKLVTKARTGTLAARRDILSRLDNNNRATKKLVETIAPKYKERAGGYTRITKLGTRSAAGDASPIAMIEFV